VKFNDSLSSEKIKIFISKGNLKSSFTMDINNERIDKFSLARIHSNTVYDSLKKAPEIDYIDYVLQYEDGTMQSLNNQVIIKLKEGSDKKDLLKYTSQYNFSRIESTIFDKNTYIVYLDNKSKFNALETARLLFETKEFEYCEPNFKKFIKPHTSDPYYNLQWALQNTAQYAGSTAGADIKINDAWTMTKGCSNIKVAVIDEGVDLTHPDLIGNLLPGYDETSWHLDGRAENDDAHGTNVAGIIAAQENSIGIVGVAPNCKIIPVRIGYNAPDGYGGTFWDTDPIWQANGIYHAWHDAGADILSNSWGGGSPSPTVTNAINTAVTSGRNNKGCLVVFSTGNENYNVTYPAVLDNVIAVGATSFCDTRKRSSSNPSELNPHVHADPLGVSCDGILFWGSNFGPEIDIAAPGVFIYSTDLQGNRGYNKATGTSGNYFDHFGETSAAAPYVSGVLALMLSINPSLTQTQARQILETNADKVGGYSYTIVSGHPNGTWNNQIGYGRLNAYKCVLAAGKAFISGSKTVCTGSSTLFTLNYPLSYTSITWTCSSNLTLVYTPSSNTALFIAKSGASGAGWVTATINACNSITMPPYTVWVGIISGHGVSGTAGVCPGNEYTYTAITPGGYSSSYSYSWSYPTGWTVSTQSADIIRLYIPSNNTQYGMVRVAITDNCGTSSYSGITVYPINCGKSFTLFPNPSTTEVNVEMDETLVSNSINTNSSFKISIYNDKGILVKNATRSGKSFSIPIEDLGEGIYIMEVNDGIMSYRERFSIKRN
jgi:subtilisin family serine protease